jgi:uncharacterized protein YjbI with pentapeptide repeats
VSAPEGRALAARWLTEEGADAADEIFARLVSGRPLDSLGLGEHKGRVDLRYLTAPIARRLQRFEDQGWFVERLGDLVEFRGVTLTGMDFTGSSLSNLRFHGAKVIGCRFDSATCTDWRLWGTDLTDCEFVGANLRNSALGTWQNGQGNGWLGINFARTDLRGTVMWGTLFEDCAFAGSRLDGVSFEQCALARCRFSGRLRRVTFDGRLLEGRRNPEPLKGLDLSEASFEEVEFCGYRLDGVALPDDPDLTLVHDFRQVCERALELLGDDESIGSRMLRAELTNRLRMMRAPREDNVLNRRDYEASGGPDFADHALDVFRRAEEAVAG